MKPIIPIEKLLTTISKPAGTFPSKKLSVFFIIHPPSGPIIIAPMNIGMSAPIIKPIVPIVPKTAPRVPPTIRPPV